jgi:integrase
MTALAMGMRASEIVSRVVRDLDDGGALLWRPDSKTLAGRRKLQVPEFLQPYLVELARGQNPPSLISPPSHDRRTQAAQHLGITRQTLAKLIGSAAIRPARRTHQGAT